MQSAHSNCLFKVHFAVGAAFSFRYTKIVFSYKCLQLTQLKGVYMHVPKPAPGEIYSHEWLIGALTQLQARYPAFIRRLSLGELSIDIGFYIEDMAMECAQALLDQGITVVHRLDRPRTISLQIPSLTVQKQALQAQQTLDLFFKRHSNPGYQSPHRQEKHPPDS